MSYLCIYNYLKNCDGCGVCKSDDSIDNEIVCPKCGETLVNGDELFFEEFTDKIIGCTHCVYTKDAEDYIFEET